MKLNEIMTREVEVVQPEDNLQAAAQKMRQWNIGFLLVYQGAQVLGVLTDRDIITRAIADGANSRNARVEDYMTTPVVHCFEDENIDDVAGLMQDQQIRRMVVLSRGQEQLVGVVSLGDLAKNGARQLSIQVLESVSARTD